MPINENDRARTGEQDVNNAHQKDNDVRQTRNDAKANTNTAQGDINSAQGATNDTQADTNSDQVDTNNAQGVTNAEQGDTNAAQGVTNTAQEATNSDQLDINLDVQETITGMREGETKRLVGMRVLADNNVVMLQTVRLLGQSLDANTKSLTAVSKALDDNQKYTESIEAKSDSRASIFKKMWILLFVIGLVGSLGLFELNSYRTDQLCEARNDLNQNNVDIINLSIDRLMEQEQTADTVDSLARLRDYVSKSAQVNCGDLIPFNGD